MMIRSDKIGKGRKMMHAELTSSPNVAFRLECFLINSLEHAKKKFKNLKSNIPIR